MYPRAVPLTLLRATVQIRVRAYPYPYGTVRIRPYTVYGTVLTPIQKAREFEKISSHGSKTSSTTETKDVDHADENHVQLQDISDPEWN